MANSELLTFNALVFAVRAFALRLQRLAHSFARLQEEQRDRLDLLEAAAGSRAVQGQVAGDHVRGA